MLAVKMPRKDVIEVVEIDIPEPGEGEVRVELKASALCRSDLHILHRSELMVDDEFHITPGHEPSGVVDKLGSQVKRIRVGDRVAIYLGIGCNTCEHCLAGDIILCKQYRCVSQNVDGGHADYMVIPVEACLPLPDDMDFVTGALATDVGGTLYTACRRLGVDGTKKVAIFGVGPMGLGGVLMAKAMGGTVIAVDVNEDRLSLARELGADAVVNSNEGDTVPALLELTGGDGVDISIVCVGASAAINNALDSTRVRGEVGLIGETTSCTVNPSKQLMRKLLDVKGCWFFNKSDWKGICDFIRDKKIPLSRISTESFSLIDAERAFRLFDSGKTQKVVFVWE